MRVLCWLDFMVADEVGQPKSMVLNGWVSESVGNLKPMHLILFLTA